MKISGADGATPVVSIDLPVAQMVSFAETETYQQLRGDDAVLVSHGAGPTIDWSLEQGGISLDAYAAIIGGTVTVAGITPAVKRTYSKLITDTRPYFKMEGQAINDNGGDFHGLIYRAKCTSNPEGDMADGKFWVTKCKGEGFGSLEVASAGKLYDFVHNEVATAIV